MKNQARILMLAFLALLGRAAEAAYPVAFAQQYTAFANHLDHAGGNRAGLLFPNLTSPVTVYKFFGGGFQAFAYDADLLEWVPSEPTINPGEGAFLRTTVAFTNNFTGAAHAPVLPVALTPGVKYFLSDQTQQIGSWESIVGTGPVEGSTVYKYNVLAQPNLTNFAGYTKYSFKNGSWQPAAPSLEVGVSAFFAIETNVPVQPTRTNAGNIAVYANRRAGLHSYIRGAAQWQYYYSIGEWRFVVPMVAVDDEYPGQLGRFPGDTIDVVMQQCFGGGFLDSINATPPKAKWSFSSGGAWSESCLNQDGITNRFGTNFAGFLDNFTRAWRDNAQLYPAEGLLQHFATAVGGRVAGGGINAIAKDPFGVPGVSYTNIQLISAGKPVVLRLLPGSVGGTNGLWLPANPPILALVTNGTNISLQGYAGVFPMVVRTNIEHGQYASSGPASDARPLQLPVPNPDNIKQYAILVAWDAAETRHGANIGRVYRTLRDAYGVPLDNIAVLYNNGTFNATNRLGPFSVAPAPNGGGIENLGTVYIDGANGPTKWLDALGGHLFTVNGTNVGGNIPGPKDRLFVYNTGHGGIEGGKVRLDYIRKNLRFLLERRDGVDDSSEGFDPGAVGADAASTLAESGLDVTNLVDPEDLLQISTWSPIPVGVHLLVNELEFGSLLPVGTNTTTYDLGSFMPDWTNTFTYQVSVPNSLLLTNGGEMEVTLAGLEPGDFDPNLVAAMLLVGGDSEAMYLPPYLNFVPSSGLIAARTGESLLLSWPSAGSTLVQASSDLSLTNWMPLVLTSSNSVLVEVTNSQMYFRILQASP